ncbi:MAG: DUF5652 family protein [Candidatus Paceibacterota bacterium]
MEARFDVALILQEYPFFVILIVILTIWSLVWKGIALWKAVKQNSPYWFVALLIINTVGILEILYIYIFSKRKKFVQKSTEETPLHF